MRNAIAIGVLALSIAAAAAPAQAGGWGHGYRGHGHAHVSGDAALVGVGIVVGALALGALLSPPHVHYAPQPAVYGRAPYCVQDEVWRTLPDGRIQTGTRTTCY